MDQGIESNLSGAAGIAIVWVTGSIALKRAAPIIGSMRKNDDGI